MNDINFQERIVAHDSQNMLQSIQDFPDQLHAAWAAMEHVTLPTHFLQASQVLVLGAGSNSIAGEILQALAAQSSTIPILLQDTATLPRWTNHRTLVIAVSYSGNDQATVGAFMAAGQRGCKLFGISTGGEIGALCRKYRAPFFQIQYGSLPRLATGYLVAPLLNVLLRLDSIELDGFTMETLLPRIKTRSDELAPNLGAERNLAKRLASQLSGKTPVFLGSRLLEPILHRFQQNWAQHVKRPAIAETFPEFQFSLLEGLQSLDTNFPLALLNFRTQWDADVDSQMQNIGKQVLGEMKVAYDEYIFPASSSALEDLLLGCHLADYVSYYAALAEGQDPSITIQLDRSQELLPIA